MLARIMAKKNQDKQIFEEIKEKSLSSNLSALSIKDQISVYSLKHFCKILKVNPSKITESDCLEEELLKEYFNSQFFFGKLNESISSLVFKYYRNFNFISYYNFLMKLLSENEIEVSSFSLPSKSASL